jgi:hypothetical protein
MRRTFAVRFEPSECHLRDFFRPYRRRFQSGFPYGIVSVRKMLRPAANQPLSQFIEQRNLGKAGRGTACQCFT